MKKTLSIIALGALGWLGTAPANAQSEEGDERSATAAASYLLLPTSARTAGLGNSLTGGLNGMTGLEAAASNPGALTTTTGTTALFSRTEYVADIGINHFGVAQPVGNGAIALTVTSWDFGDIPLTDAAQNSDPSSLTYNASATIVGGTYARQFTDRISAGLTAKFVNEQIDDMDASSVAFDAGIEYEVGESGLQFGVSLRNFGGKMKFGGNGLRDNDNNGTPIITDAEEFELPSLLNFGASFTRQFAGDLSASATGNFRANAYDQQQFAGGVELGYGGLVFVRGGVDLVPDQDQTFYQGWNAGAGVNLDLGGSRIVVDYAYRGTEFFDGVNMFTAAVSL